MLYAPEPTTQLVGLLRRRLGPEDRPAILTHLLGLPAQDRVARWNGARSDDALREDCAALDLSCASPCLALGAFRGDALLGVALGVATAEGLAEIAVSVDAAHRRLGIGTALVAALHAKLQLRFGTAHARLFFEPENIPIQGVVRRLGGTLRPALGCGDLGSDPPRVGQGRAAQP